MHRLLRTLLLMAWNGEAFCAASEQEQFGLYQSYLEFVNEDMKGSLAEHRNFVKKWATSYGEASFEKEVKPSDAIARIQSRLEDQKKLQKQYVNKKGILQKDASRDLQQYIQRVDEVANIVAKFRENFRIIEDEFKQMLRKENEDKLFNAVEKSYKEKAAEIISSSGSYQNQQRLCEKSCSWWSCRKSRFKAFCAYHCPEIKPCK